MYPRFFTVLISPLHSHKVESLLTSYLRLVLGNLAAWAYGAGIVFPSEIFDPHAIVDAIIEEKCTALHGVPTHFLGVLAEIDDRRARGEEPDTRSLR